MVKFNGAAPVAGTMLTVIACAYIVIILVRNSYKFCHLWNRIAVLIFGCVFIQSIFSVILQFYDTAKETESQTLSDTLCSVTFGVEEFLTTTVQVLYAAVVT